MKNYERTGHAIIFAAFYATLFAAALGVPWLAAFVGFTVVGLSVTAWVGWMEIKEVRRGRR